MTDTTAKTSRKSQILQALAAMLEATPGGKITTAALAKEVGASEAALYRHFPSKARMFEGLIEFIENALLTHINTVQQQPITAAQQLHDILYYLLAFAEQNPGITRLLTGDALSGENTRLRARIAQLYDALETQLKQILRNAEFKEGLRTRLAPGTAANLLLSYAEGRIAQYVRSDFSRSPTHHWEEQWQQLESGLYRDAHK